MSQSPVLQYLSPIPMLLPYKLTKPVPDCF